jgi:hypothetical protein
MRCRPGIVTYAEFGKIPDLRCTANALHRVRETCIYFGSANAGFTPSGSGALNTFNVIDTIA